MVGPRPAQHLHVFADEKEREMEGNLVCSLRMPNKILNKKATDKREQVKPAFWAALKQFGQTRSIKKTLLDNSQTVLTILKHTHTHTRRLTMKHSSSFVQDIQRCYHVPVCVCCAVKGIENVIYIIDLYLSSSILLLDIDFFILLRGG